jgi:hypothetical protein
MADVTGANLSRSAADSPAVNEWTPGPDRGEEYETLPFSDAIPEALRIQVDCTLYRWAAGLYLLVMDPGSSGNCKREYVTGDGQQEPNNDASQFRNDIYRWDGIFRHPLELSSCCVSGSRGCVKYVCTHHNYNSASLFWSDVKYHAKGNWSKQTRDLVLSL